MPAPALTLTTPPTPGAVAILQLHGEDAEACLRHWLGNLAAFVVGQLRLTDFAGIDHGLLARVADHTWQLMPHGGPRIVQKMREALLAHGVIDGYTTDEAAALFPEATSPIEADVLQAIATAASPAAIDRLAQQPALWRNALRENQLEEARAQAELHAAALDRLLRPPTVVVVGPPNAGKSTLLNALAGRTLALVADLPGTTRDWVGGLIELAPPGADPLRDAVAVRWLDTPGLRDGDDAVEQRAIEAARSVIETADVLIAMRDPEQDWPSADALPRTPDLWVLSKADQITGKSRVPESPPPGTGSDRPLPLSVHREEGIDCLIDTVLSELGVTGLPSHTLWVFAPGLRARLRDRRGLDALAAYLGVG